MESNNRSRTPLEKEMVRLGTVITQKGYASAYCIQGLNCEDTFLETLEEHVLRNPENAFPVMLTGAVGKLHGTTALFASFFVENENGVLKISLLRLCYRDEQDRLDKHDMKIRCSDDLLTMEQAHALMVNRHSKQLKVLKKQKRS